MAKCRWKGCSISSVLEYSPDSKKYSLRGLCWKHWQLLCSLQEKGKGNTARAKIGLPPEEKQTKSSEAEGTESPEERVLEEPITPHRRLCRRRRRLF